MARIGLFIVLVLTTEGCAIASGSRPGHSRGDRPVVAVGLGRNQVDPGGFGGNRVPTSVPTDLPLPAKADPRTMFALPNIGGSTTDALYGVANGISVLLNCVPDLSGRSPRECAAKADRNFREVIPRPQSSRGPVTLR